MAQELAEASGPRQADVVGQPNGRLLESWPSLPVAPVFETAPPCGMTRAVAQQPQSEPARKPASLRPPAALQAGMASETYTPGPCIV